MPPGVIPIRIEAGLAFGTGHHETTALCLGALSDLSKRRRFDNVLDLGCGTGLLAIGAAKLWRKPVLASDIDVVAVEVTRENAAANGEAPLVRALTADGLTHPVLAQKAPLRPDHRQYPGEPPDTAGARDRPVARAGGMALLSGLLAWQENMVTSFYRPQGLVYRGARRSGSWSALLLERPLRGR